MLRFGQQCRNNVRLCRKDEISTLNSFDIVAVFGNKVERCFDIVAGVDRALCYCITVAPSVSHAPVALYTQCRIVCFFGDAYTSQYCQLVTASEVIDLMAV